MLRTEIAIFRAALFLTTSCTQDTAAQQPSVVVVVVVVVVAVVAVAAVAVVFAVVAVAVAVAIESGAPLSLLNGWWKSSGARAYSLFHIYIYSYVVE